MAMTKEDKIKDERLRKLMTKMCRRKNRMYERKARAFEADPNTTTPRGWSSSREAKLREAVREFNKVKREFVEFRTRPKWEEITDNED